MPRQRNKFNPHMKPSGTDADIVQHLPMKCPNCEIKLERIMIRRKGELILRECSQCDFVVKV